VLTVKLCAQFGRPIGALVRKYYGCRLRRRLANPQLGEEYSEQKNTDNTHLEISPLEQAMELVLLNILTVRNVSKRRPRERWIDRNLVAQSRREV